MSQVPTSALKSAVTRATATGLAAGTTPGLTKATPLDTRILTAKPLEQRSSAGFDLPTLAADLPRVEAALRSAVAANDPFLTEVAHTLIAAGGKRIRPLLSLAAGHLAHGYASDDVVQSGVAVELIHLGSLYHDDVMDEAETRRGVATANARFGNFVAIMAGDFCLARASEIAAALGTEMAALMAATIGRLCEGQVREVQFVFATDRTEEAYLQAIEGKTASLMATACRAGALAAGMPRTQVDALTTYGLQLGMVFQIQDDVLDIVATDEQLGKPAGNDVVEGVYTLPVIRALLDTAHGDELHALLSAGVERTGIDQIRKLVKASGGVDAAIEVGRQFASSAAAALSDFDGPVANGLRELGPTLLRRLPS
jgi:heptaprenyl diphosphate synthase